MSEGIGASCSGIPILFIECQGWIAGMLSLPINIYLPAAEALRRDMKIQPVCVTSWQSFDRQKENERERARRPLS